MVCLLGRAQALFRNWNQLVTRRHEERQWLRSSHQHGDLLPCPFALCLQALKYTGLGCLLFRVCRGSCLAVQAVDPLRPSPRCSSTPASGVCTSDGEFAEEMVENQSPACRTAAMHPSSSRHSSTPASGVCYSGAEAAAWQYKQSAPEALPHALKHTGFWCQCFRVFSKAAAWRKKGSAARRIEAMPWGAQAHRPRVFELAACRMDREIPSCDR